MTPKKSDNRTPIDRNRLVAKLEEIAETVSRRPVYLALSQDSQSYKIIEHLSQSVILSDVPNKPLAEKLALRMNSRKQVPPQKIRRARGIISAYQKHQSDIMHYEHTIQHSTDDFRRDTARIRLEFSAICLNKTLRDLERSL